MGKNRELRSLVRDILSEELQGLLHDVSYRLGVLYDAQMGSGRLGSRDLNLAAHQLDGFTVTDNSPTAGKIAWTDCNIVYKGVNYTITSASTDLKYIWWKLSATPNNVFQMSNDKPTLSDDDVLVFINDGGTHQTVIGSGRMTSGAAILTGSIGSGEIGSQAITTAKLASGAVTSTILGDKAVTTGKLGDSAVNSTQLADNAVTSGKIGSGAVTDGKLGTNAVNSTNIKDLAISEGKLAANAVTDAKIKDGAVVTTKLAGTSVTTDKLAGSAVTTDKISNGAVTGTKIGAGAVATDKLNTALHMIF